MSVKGALLESLKFGLQYNHCLYTIALLIQVSVPFQTLAPGLLSVSAPTPAPLKKQVEFEPVTEVHAKSLKKAMTPPVTIRNFFKTVTKEDLPCQDKDRVTAAQGAPPKASDSKPDQSVDSKDAKGNCSSEDATNEVNEQTSTSHTGNSRRGSDVLACRENKQNRVKNVEKESKGKEPVRLTRANSRVTDSNRGLKRDIVLSPDAETEASKFSKKAKIEEGKASTEKGKVSKKPTKPAKQANLMAAFANADKNKTKECPICRKQFKATSLNKEINDHIDNCLID